MPGDTRDNGPWSQGALSPRETLDITSWLSSWGCGSTLEGQDSCGRGLSRDLSTRGSQVDTGLCKVIGTCKGQDTPWPHTLREVRCPGWRESAGEAEVGPELGDAGRGPQGKGRCALLGSLATGCPGQSCRTGKDKAALQRLPVSPEVPGEAGALSTHPRSRAGAETHPGTSLVVQWLRLRASNAGGKGLIPGQGTKIPHAV